MEKLETTTSYHWRGTPEGLIDRIEIVRQKNGRAVAYLHANEDPEQKAQRLQIRAMLRAKGWGTLSDYRDGQFVLRVNGFNDEKVLLDLLHETGFTKGTPIGNTQASDKERPQGFIDSIRTNSLRASGIFYSLGNLVYLASGLLRNQESKEKKTGQIASALKWGAGDILVATIGGRDDGRQLGSLLTKLKTHYEREGIDIPETAAIYSETRDHNRGLGNKIYNFLHDYLNQIKCFTESWAAYSYYHAGKEQGNFKKQITAVIFGIGFFISGIVPEKKLDPEKYAQAGPLGKLWMKIQNNPLSVGGLSGYSNTILTTMSAYEEGQRFNNPLNHPPAIDKKTGMIIKPSKYYKLDYAAPAVMSFGNGLYALSKKTTGGDIRTEAMVDDVYSVASQILNKQPVSKRAEAFESTVRFLAERPEVRGDKDEVRAKLAEVMKKQSENPWFESVALPAPAPHAATKAKHHDAQPETTLARGETTHVGKGVEAANDMTLSAEMQRA